MTDLPVRPHWRASIDDIVHDTWFERDRSYLILYLRKSEDDGDYGETFAEWWDDDLTTAAGDGFLSPKDWKQTGFDYARHLGETKAEQDVNETLERVWTPLMTAAREASEGDAGYVLSKREEESRLLLSVPPSVRELVSDTMSSVMANRPDPTIGYQIVDADGQSIHGDDDDPFDLHSFTLLVGDAVDAARQWTAENEGYTVRAFKVDEIEEPEFVDAVTLSRAPSVAP